MAHGKVGGNDSLFEDTSGLSRFHTVIENDASLVSCTKRSSNAGLSSSSPLLHAVGSEKLAWLVEDESGLAGTVATQSRSIGKVAREIVMPLPPPHFPIDMMSSNLGG